MKSVPRRGGVPGSLAAAGCALSLWLTAPSLAAPARAAERVVGLVPSETPAITASLAAGARLALERARREGGPNLRLEIGRAGDHWGTLTPSIVELLEQRHALALITPPERATAHLVAQIGTRSQIPVVTTSSAASITAAGSRWVVAAVERSADGSGLRAPRLPSSGDSTTSFLADLRRFHGYETANGWTVAGHDAALVIVEAFRRAGRDDTLALANAIADGTTIEGASGRFRIDSAGIRIGGREALPPISVQTPPPSADEVDAVSPPDGRSSHSPDDRRIVLSGEREETGGGDIAELD